MSLNDVLWQNFMICYTKYWLLQIASIVSIFNYIFHSMVIISKCVGKFFLSKSLRVGLWQYILHLIFQVFLHFTYAYAYNIKLWHIRGIKIKWVLLKTATFPLKMIYFMPFNYISKCVGHLCYQSYHLNFLMIFLYCLFVNCHGG